MRLATALTWFIVVEGGVTLPQAMKRGNVKAEAEALSESAKVPPLKRRIAKALKEDPSMPWDRVIAKLAASEAEVS